MAPARQVLAPYADPVIFLFLGSFLLAEAVSRYGLDVRLASWLLGLPVFARTAPGRMAAFGTASAAISTVLSNTATAALMTPIALGALGDKGEGRPRRADSGVLLMIAYGASIGGMATLIGTPPNLLVAGFLERLAGVRVTFTGWLAFALPIATALLLVSLVLTRLTLGRDVGNEVPPLDVRRDAGGVGEDASEKSGRRAVDGRGLLPRLRALARPLAGPGRAGAGAPSRRDPGEALPRGRGGAPLRDPAVRRPGELEEATVRPELGGRPARQLGRADALRGGLSLGTLGEATGIAKWAGEGVVSSGLATSPESFMLLAVIAAITVSEFASNTASATLLVPIVIAAARQAGFDPVPPALAAGLAATCGFVFPVSTPPNAIVFGTGRVPLTRMIRAGALLDVACVLVVWTGVLLLRPWLPRAG